MSLNLTKKDLNKLLTEERAKTLAEVIIKTQPLLTISFWAEKLGYTRQGLYFILNKYYPNFIEELNKEKNK